MKILHVFYSTLPSALGGDIRSRDLIEAQSDAGLDVLAVSSPFQPPSEAGVKLEYLRGIPCYRTFNEKSALLISDRDQGLIVKIRKFMKIFTFSAAVTNLARREKPDVIHAHSTFFCAFASWVAAKSLGVPMIYEVRSLWEERSIFVAPSLTTRVIGRTVRVIETVAMRLADHLIVISEGLKLDLAKRGIPEDRIALIGNGANLNRVTSNFATAIEKAPSEWIFAYVGNIGELEGLDLLVEAISVLRARGWTNQVYLYGDGPALEELKLQAKGLEGIVFHGSFEPDAAPAIYSGVDVVVNPRRRSNLTDTVTPLKPLEAMAWRKPVITSSVGGMLELVSHGETGFVFEADSLDCLVEALEDVKRNLEILPTIIERARTFVANERSWHANALKYKALYTQLTGRAA